MKYRDSSVLKALIALLSTQVWFPALISQCLKQLLTQVPGYLLISSGHHGNWPSCIQCSARYIHKNKYILKKKENMKKAIVS